MARKAKRRVHQMPRLSLSDKLIYWFLMLLLIIVYFLLLLLPLDLRRWIAFRDEAVIASADSASLLWLLVPWITFFLMTFILWLQPYQSRRPIFGIRNFKYGPPAWPKIYPLFMKDKPRVYVSERKRKQRKYIAVLLLILLLISFLPLPLGLYGRDSLRKDGSILQYNMFNRLVREFSPGDISRVELGTFRYSTGKTISSDHWGITMIFFTESGRKYRFDSGDFFGNSQTDVPFWLTAMLDLKNLYRPETVSYNGTENLEKVVADRNLSVKAQELLYQLFQL